MSTRLLFFEAPWCESCHKVKPLISAKAHAANVPIEYFNVGFREDMLVAARWSVGVLPFLIEFDDDKPVRSLCGTAIMGWEPRERSR